MDSRTRHRLSRERIHALVRAHLGSGWEVKGVQELTGGMFNAVYAVELHGASPVVLKVGPRPEVPVLTYEHGLMRTEVDYYTRVSRETACPVPRVLAYDFSRSIIPSDCFFMERLRGAPLNEAKRRVPRKELARVKAEWGGIVRRLSAIQGERFGYASPGAQAQADTWRDAFLQMVRNLLMDAGRFSVRLPLQPEAILSLFEARADALEEVRTPVLTHFDLWEGNVFVHWSGGQLRVEALTDGERAFWGDPHAELVSAALFKELDEEPDFLRGYEAAMGRPLERSAGLSQRLTLYRAYLYLIMRIEGAPRGYSGLRHALMRRYVAHRLVRELKKLAAGPEP